MGLLCQGFHAHELGARLLYRQPDGPCVGVGLVATHEGAHGLGVDQPHEVALRRQLSRPAVHAAAGFDADDTRRTVGKVLQHLGPLELQVDDLARAGASTLWS